MNQDPTGKGTGFDQVRNLIGYPTELRYVNIDKQYFGCLDGRISVPILGILKILMHR